MILFARSLLFIVFLGLLPMVVACKKPQVISSETKTEEKVNVTWKDTTITIPGFSIGADLNLDSLIQANIPAGKTEIRKVYITDTTGNGQLSYWYNEAGRLRMECKAKDQEKELLLKDVERIVSTYHSQTVEQQKSFVEEIKDFLFWLIVVLSLIAGLFILLRILK